MRKVNMLPPVEIYDVLHEAEAADIAIPPIVDKWWEEETALNVGAQPPQADNNRRDEIIRLLDCISADERTEIFHEYCTHCGAKNPSCQCWNDE